MRAALGNHHPQGARRSVHMRIEFDPIANFLTGDGTSQCTYLTAVLSWLTVGAVRDEGNSH